MNVVVLGLSITSSWGNGHATTYRSLLRELARRGHEITFLERDVPWYADHRDLKRPSFCRLILYRSLRQLQSRWASLVANADAVVIGSFVPQGILVADWICRIARGLRVFYDIDTPETLSRLDQGQCDYLSLQLIPRFDIYLSFTGGTALRTLRRLGARSPQVLYCSADPELYRPQNGPRPWDLGYLGTYSADRQGKLERLLLEPALALRHQRFVVAGAQYPDEISWPNNLDHIAHVPPNEHPAFYGRQRFTLNLTRSAMVRTGWAPSVRLFEAAACGVPVLSDRWPGLDELLVPGEEVILVDDTRQVVDFLRTCTEERRRAIGAAARQRVLREHTSMVRARELETILDQARRERQRVRRRAPADASIPADLAKQRAQA